MPFQHACSALRRRTSLLLLAPIRFSGTLPFICFPPFFFFFKRAFRKIKIGGKIEKKVKENLWKKCRGGACGIQTGQLSGGGVSEGESLRAAMWALLFLGPPHTVVNEKKMSELWRGWTRSHKPVRARAHTHTRAQKVSLYSGSFYFLSFIKM